MPFRGEPRDEYGMLDFGDAIHKVEEDPSQPDYGVHWETEYYDFDKGSLRDRECMPLSGVAKGDDPGMPLLREVPLDDGGSIQKISGH